MFEFSALTCMSSKFGITCWLLPLGWNTLNNSLITDTKIMQNWANKLFCLVGVASYFLSWHKIKLKVIRHRHCPKIEWIMFNQFANVIYTMEIIYSQPMRKVVPVTINYTTSQVWHHMQYAPIQELTHKCLRHLRLVGLFRC